MSNQDRPSELDVLIGQLSSKDAVTRMNARHALVELGPAATAAVARLADSSDDHMRWECAKTLAHIADPSSVDTLIRLLEDREGTRWDAALGLIAIGKPTVTPLLKAIIHLSPEYKIIPGARHVIHELSKADWGGFLSPVYEGLNSYVARETAPGAAYKALQQWEYSDLAK